MATPKPTANAEDELLKRPLYVYDLPAPLLASLSLKTELIPTTTTITTTITPSKTPGDDEIANATSCALCGVANSNVDEQRTHYRSDFHRFNLKLKVRGHPAVVEGEFEKMVGDLDESISGSESDSDSASEDNDDARLATLVRRKAALAAVDQDGAPAVLQQRKKRGAGKPPLVWFTTPQLPKEVSLGVYRALFTNQEQAGGDYLQYLRGRQLTSEKKKNSPHIFLCMIGGGHFAAMVVSLTPKAGGQGNREAVVLAHKTFHRYTTRRKQGGSQSSNDNAKGAAHSAGASIRRHNEAALTAEVRELLGNWKELLQSAELLFVRATGTQNRRTLFGYDEAVFKSKDPRIRGFPFSTRRATQSELMRSFVELTRIKVSRVDEAALAALAATDPTATLPKAKSPLPAPKVSKEDEEALLHASQLTALIRRSKAPAVLSYLNSNKLPADYRFHPPAQHHHSPTPLHLAAALNSPAVVSALLTKAGADPTLENGDGKTPFLIAGDRATRDAFRICRGELGESRWDWEKAGVPAALQRAEVEERERREREEKEQGERERREREVARLKEQEEEEAGKGKGKGKKKGGIRGMALGAGLGKMEEEARGLTPEARQRLDRERRARAAEERIRRMQGQ